MIPKIIHQIWIGEEAPNFIQEATATVKNLNPDFEYMFWGNEAIEEFGLKDEFEMAKEIAFFTNVLRIKILEKFGGVYIDADTKCVQPLNDWFQKYQNYPLSSIFVNNIFPDNGIIVAKPEIDYYLALVDYNLQGPISFYWQRLQPHKIPREEVGIDGEYLQDLKLNSWIKN
jgi:hypothetical protein